MWSDEGTNNKTSEAVKNWKDLDVKNLEWIGARDSHKIHVKT